MLENSQAENLSDEELASLCLKNQDYYAYIIQRYKTKIFYYVKRITNVCETDIEDLLQEIFLKAYLNLNDFDSNYKFSSWLYSIAHNQVISNYRKLQARPESRSFSLDDDDAKKIAANIDHEKEMDNNFKKEIIFKILKKIAPKYREVLILKFLEEKSYQEISDIIKKPMGTVASMLNKAKQEFKKELDKNNIKISI